MKCRPLLTSCCGTAAFLGVAALAALVLFAARRWFGIGDWRAIAFWSLVIAVPMTPSAWCLARCLRNADRGWRWVGIVVAGTLAGYAATAGVAWILGPWFGAFSIPVLYCWVAGAIAACATNLAPPGRCQCRGRTE